MTTSDTASDEVDGEPTTVSRRDFLNGIGASVALSAAFVAGCTRAPEEKIVPYRVQPEDVLPGRPAHYASAMTLDGYATGLVIESHEGKPTKIEGNPEHPASRGASGAREQAALLELYSPRRLQSLRRSRSAISASTLSHALARVGATGGRGVHIVLPPTSSFTVSQLLDRLRERFPELHVHYHSPLSRAQAWAGAQLAFGRVLEVRPSLERAQVALSLDADFLNCGPDYLARAREFADARRVLSTRDEMNRLYCVEATLSVTGQCADHRLALRDRELPTFAGRLLNALREGKPGNDQSPFIRALAKDLLEHRGRSLVLVGDRQPASVHASGHALNALLGNVGATVKYAPSPIRAAGASEHDSLPGLAEALTSGTVSALIVLGTDVIGTAPRELRLCEHWPRSNSFYWGLFDDATARACEYVLPAAHWLESWGDARSLDGTASIVQPLIAPLYDGLTETQVLAALLGDAATSAHELVRRALPLGTEREFEAEWENALARGTLPATRIAEVPTPELAGDFVAKLTTSASETGLELSLVPDSRLLDGRFANNAWLVELPEPTTKLTWTNAALIAPATAQRLGITTGDVLRLKTAHGETTAPALLQAEQAEDTVALSLGWGKPGTLAVGGDGFALISRAQPWSLPVSLERVGEKRELPITQLNGTVEPHEAARYLAHATLTDYRARPGFCANERKVPLSLYPDNAPGGAQWGMLIDLNVCTGCSACVIACQAENNIPSVGASGVLQRREMHWLRIDRYSQGRTTVLQPMACQHCEHAPCEYVCPVGATVHSSDGLNQMVYNRCVGTRFCSNNCPYKVRRFNWFNYHTGETPVRELAHNPNVSVRARGVMEKCTYCVQRIRQAQLSANAPHTNTATRLPDGTVTPACAQACPAGAIVFGDLSDPNARVTRLHKNERAFAALNELGTRPRTRYLAKLINPNPELVR